MISDTQKLNTHELDDITLATNINLSESQNLVLTIFLALCKSQNIVAPQCKCFMDLQIEKTQQKPLKQHYTHYRQQNKIYDTTPHSCVYLPSNEITLTTDSNNFGILILTDPYQSSKVRYLTAENITTTLMLFSRVP